MEIQIQLFYLSLCFNINRYTVSINIRGVLSIPILFNLNVNHIIIIKVCNTILTTFCSFPKKCEVLCQKVQPI